MGWGCRLTCTPHIQPSQNDENGTTTLATPSWPGLRRQAGWSCGQGGGGQGEVAGRVGWRAWWDGGLGRVEGRVGLRGGGGGQGGRRGMDLQSKECSGVNIVA